MRRGVAERIIMLKDMLEEDLATTSIDVDVDGSVMRHVVSFYDWLVDNAGASEQDKKNQAQVRAYARGTLASSPTLVPH